MFTRLKAYLDSIHARDPAPRSRWEILLYPGSSAGLVTQRLLLSDMQRKTIITEYWNRDDDDRWRLAHRKE